jgi:ABC-type antimicrobial peptide transport system permease subunit
MRSPSAPRRSASAWRSARSASTCSGWSSENGTVLALSGIAIGLAAAFALARLIAALLFQTSTDPPTFSVVPLLLFAVAILASYLPARRAARVDPMAALRYE